MHLGYMLHSSVADHTDTKLKQGQGNQALPRKLKKAENKMKTLRQTAEEIVQNSTDQISDIKDLAVMFLYGIKDKAGRIMVKHAIDIAEDIEVEDGSMNTIAIALLHDVIEDTSIPKSVLQHKLLDISAKYGYAPLFNVDDVVVGVEILTRRDDETYFDYISRVSTSKNRSAIDVKIRDLKHHLSHKDDINQSLIDRYEKALKILEERFSWIVDSAMKNREILAEEYKRNTNN